MNNRFSLSLNLILLLFVCNNFSAGFTGLTSSDKKKYLVSDAQKTN